MVLIRFNNIFVITLPYSIHRYGSGIIITIFLLIYWGFKSNFFLHLGVACGWLKPSKQLYEDLEDAEGFSFMITDSPFAKKSFEPKKKLFRLMIRQVCFVLSCRQIYSYCVIKTH